MFYKWVKQHALSKVNYNSFSKGNKTFDTNCELACFESHENKKVVIIIIILLESWSTSGLFLVLIVVQAGKSQHVADTQIKNVDILLEALYLEFH